MKVHLIDGTYELFRSFFGAPEAKSPSGQEVGATRGFLRSMAAMLNQTDVTHVGVAFDHTIESFRNDLFDGYKTGEGIDEELLAQFELVEQASSALGMTVWPMVEFEADDALAAAAAKFAKDPSVEQVVICTPDKDLCQCVEGTRVVTYDRRRDIMLDVDGVIEKFGILPKSITDYLALVGDTADGIPGVARWGAKSTSLVLAEYKRIEDIPADADEWSVKVRGASALAANLNDAHDDALLYRKLATLRKDAPIPESLADLEWKGPDRDKLKKFCADIGESAVLDRI